MKGAVIILDLKQVPKGRGLEVEIDIGEREDGEAFRVDVLAAGQLIYRSEIVPTRKEAEDLASTIERELISQGGKIMPANVGHA